MLVETDFWLLLPMTGKVSGEVNLRFNGRDGVAPLAWIKLYAENTRSRGRWHNFGMQLLSMTKLGILEKGWSG